MGEVGVPGEKAGRVEAFGVSKFGVNVDIDAEGTTVTWRGEKPVGEITGEVDEGIVASFGDDHDGTNGAFEGFAL